MRSRSLRAPCPQAPLGPGYRIGLEYSNSFISPTFRVPVGLAPFSLEGPGRMERGRASELLSAPRGLLYSEQAPSTGISGSNRAYGFYFSQAFSFFSLPPPPPLSTKWCTLPLRLKWWLATIRTPLPVGRGAGPQPAHAGSGLRFQDGDSLCN